MRRTFGYSFHISLSGEGNFGVFIFQYTILNLKPTQSYFSHGREDTSQNSDGIGVLLSGSHLKLSRENIRKMRCPGKGALSCVRADAQAAPTGPGNLTADSVTAGADREHTKSTEKWVMYGCESCSLP